MRWFLTVAAVSVIGAVGAGLYYGYDEMEGLRQETAHCGEPGCEQLADTSRGLQFQLDKIQAQDLPGKIVNLETEVQRLKNAVSAATAERDKLSEQMVRCGEDGCMALMEKHAAAQTELAAVKKDLTGAQEKLAAAQKGLNEAQTKLGELKGREVRINKKLAMGEEENDRLRTKLRDEFAEQAGRRITISELFRIGPFDVGSFKLDSDKLAKVEEALSSHKGKPLLVVGIADKRPFKGPSGELKQLGLMLARARIVKEMGYEVYYQVRQDETAGPDSRAVIVYGLSIGSPSTGNMARKDTAPGAAIPTFYVSSMSQAG